MEIDIENDKGVRLFNHIIMEQDYLKTGNENYSNHQLDSIGVLRDNIIAIALGKDYTSMDYIAANKEDIDNPSLERKKKIYETTSQKEIINIDLLKAYFATRDLKPLQDYLDSLF